MKIILLLMLAPCLYAQESISLESFKLIQFIPAQIVEKRLHEVKGEFDLYDGFVEYSDGQSLLGMLVLRKDKECVILLDQKGNIRRQTQWLERNSNSGSKSQFRYLNGMVYYGSTTSSSFRISKKSIIVDNPWYIHSVDTFPSQGKLMFVRGVNGIVPLFSITDSAIITIDECWTLKKYARDGSLKNMWTLNSPVAGKSLSDLFEFWNDPIVGIFNTKAILWNKSLFYIFDLLNKTTYTCNIIDLFNASKHGEVQSEGEGLGISLFSSPDTFYFILTTTKGKFVYKYIAN